MIIRKEESKDYKEVLRLTYKAFQTLDLPGRQRTDEHFLIHLLQDSKFVIPELCFVAEDENNAIMGHILYTKSEVSYPDGRVLDTITFGPLSVLPEKQNEGIGKALIAHSIDEARRLGYGAVLITGIPEYYPKLGFHRAREYGITLEDGTAEDYFMVYEIKEGYLSAGGVLRFLPPEFEISEKDDEGYEMFHKQFVKERL